MQLPHRVTVVTPTETPDPYGNPTPILEFGPDSPRRVIRGYVQPITSVEPVEPGRQPVITTWRMFTFSPVGARERVEWKGRAYRVDGEPEAWEPRPGRARYWVRLIEVEG